MNMNNHNWCKLTKKGCEKCIPQFRLEILGQSHFFPLTPIQYSFNYFTFISSHSQSTVAKD